MHLLAAGGCLRQNAYFCAEYYHEYKDSIYAALHVHVSLTVRSVLLALAIALPLAVAVRRRPRLRTAALGVSGTLYTIPSVAAFALLLPIFGPTNDTAPLIALTSYNLLALLRNVLVGLDEVPAEVREAARGMGFGSLRMLWRVELPLAVPAIVAGVRIATVSTIALATVGAVVGFGGLGQLLYTAQQSSFHAQIVAALGLCVLLAVVAELLLLGLTRLVTPWRRVRPG